MGKLQDRVEELYMDYFNFFKRHRGCIVVLGSKAVEKVVKLEYYSETIFEEAVRDMNLSAKPFSMETGTIDIEEKQEGLLSGSLPISLEDKRLVNLKKVIELAGQNINPVVKLNIKPKRASHKWQWLINLGEVKGPDWIEIIESDSQRLINFREDLIDYFELQKQLKGFLAEKPAEEEKGFK